MISFAQNFEDVLLERLFKDKKRGFYVDVGAWDPNRYSVTRHFYDRGWRGINIEPIAQRHQLFVDQRTRDVNLLQLIGSETTTMRFGECVDADYLSTTVPQIIEDLKNTGHEISEYDVEVATLDAIFERYCPKTVDFLKIDTEGSEAEVLGTIDLTRHRPRALVIESTVPGSGLKSWDEPDAYGTWAEWEQRVLDADYVFACFDGLNRFYLRREDSRLTGRLILPPGIYDGIDCTDNWQSRAVERLEVIDRQQEEIATLRQRAEDIAVRFRQSVDDGEAGRKAQDAAAAELETRLQASERDRAARLELIEQLTGERDEDRAALAQAERTFAERLEAARAASDEDRAALAEAERTFVGRLEAARAASDAAASRLAEQVEEAERDRAARLVVIERLAAELDASRISLAEAGTAAMARIETIVEADRVARGEVVGGLVEQLGAVERDRAARLTLIERLTAELDDSRRMLAEAERVATARIAAVEADRVARGEVIESLVGQLAAIERDRAARLALIEQLTAGLDDSRRALAAADRAGADRLEAVEADRIARGEVIESLVNQLGAVERDRAARLALIEQLTARLADAEQAGAARLAAVEADRIARGEVIESLVNQLGAVERDRAARLALIEQLTIQLDDSRRALADAEQAGAARLEAVEADRIARGEVIESLVNQLGAVERDRAARLALIEQLTIQLDDSRRALADAEQAGAARLEAVEADRIARGEVIESLVNQLGAVERDRAARLALIEQLTIGLDNSRRALADAEQAGVARIEAIEADRVARGEVIESLVNQLGAVERDRAARLGLIERLTVELDNSRAARADDDRAAAARVEAVERDRLARGQVIAGLEDRLAAVERDGAARLDLIERLTKERDESRSAIVEAERAAAGRLQSVEADRVARGEVIDDLVERLRTAQEASESQDRSIDRLRSTIGEGERRIADLERSISHMDGDLAEARELTLRRDDALSAQADEIAALTEQLAASSADAASLRGHWSYRLLSFVRGRA